MHILHNYFEVQLITTFKTQTWAQVSPNTKSGFRKKTLHVLLLKSAVLHNTNNDDLYN